MAGDLPANFGEIAAQIASDAHDAGATVASRKASQLALEGLTAALPELLGGSADLTGSNLTNTKSTPSLRVDDKGAVVLTEDGKIGRHINYGVREFGMAAIMNGIALHGGYIPYAGTFLTFSDYSRNAIRMAALMKQRVVHVFTHDSIGLGEDGPTHQSIEHAASLRLIPGLDVWRPADTTETAVAWTVALSQKNKPTALLLSRQNLAYAAKTEDALDDIACGAYVLSEPKAVGLNKKAQAVIIATGSEVQLALAAQKLLAERKVAVRVVSMPSTTTFDKQDARYKSQVLPANLPRIAVEMGVTDFWWKYGCAAVVGIDTYGESAPRPCCSSTSASRPRTWPTPCRLRCSAPASKAARRGLWPLLPPARPGLALTVSVFPFSQSVNPRGKYDDQDRYQRLRPHRPHGVPRCRAELQRHRSRGHQRPARARLPGLHAQVRQRARPLQG